MKNPDHAFLRRPRPATLIVAVWIIAAILWFLLWQLLLLHELGWFSR
jgi:hypothetical protein